MNPADAALPGVSLVNSTGGGFGHWMKCSSSVMFAVHMLRENVLCRDDVN